MPLSSTRLLRWFDRNRRDLPWRAAKGKPPNPYHIWLSEIMLQQTTIAAATPYFERFIHRFPNVQTLAQARAASIMRLWAGLGYYRRAHNLHAAAKMLVKKHRGKLPSHEEDLRRLPGVGAYTAAAIAAIAFNQPAIGIDANVARLFARLFAIEETGTAKMKKIHEQTDQFASKRAGDFMQALMELGALVCRVKNPVCEACPWRGQCRAYARNAVADFPRAEAKKARPVRYGAVFWLARPDGKVLLRQRPNSGLLAGMMELPGSSWNAAPSSRPLMNAPIKTRWQKKAGVIRHTFTHFHLELTAFAARISDEQAAGLAGSWAGAQDFPKLALPSLMRKAAQHILNA